MGLALWVVELRYFLSVYFDLLLDRQGLAQDGRLA